MKKTPILLISLLLSLSGCSVPTVSEGPTDGESIENALNKRNFDFYTVQSDHVNHDLGVNVFAQATITMQDFKFITKSRNFLNPVEISSYYFDNIYDDFGSYDVYYKEKSSTDDKYLGNSFYQKYNLSQEIDNIPNFNTLKTYYNVFDMSKLDPAEFSYDTDKGGWYVLNEEAYNRVLESFFELNVEDFELIKFNVQVERDKVNSIVYRIEDRTNGLIKAHELFFMYQVPSWLNETHYSLINNVEIAPFETEDPTSEEPTSEEPTSEEPTSEEPISENLTSELTSGLFNPDSNLDEPTEQVEWLKFAIYNDYHLFQKDDAPNAIQHIALYHNFDYGAEDPTINPPISEILLLEGRTIKDRQLPIYNNPLVRGNRYLVRLTLTTGEIYDHSFIY